MKRLMLCSAFVLPLLANQAAAECQHGSYAMKDHNTSLEELIAKETDPAKLALLMEQLEEKEALESKVVTYN